MTTPTTVPTFPCTAGLRIVGWTTHFFIRSPRTGKELLMSSNDGCSMPHRFAARTIKLRSEGGSILHLTAAELKDIFTAYQALEQEKHRKARANVINLLGGDFRPRRRFAR